MASPIRKITVNIPESLIKTATQITGLGITGAVIEGLRELEKREKRSALRKLRGNLSLNIDIEKTRR